MRFCKAASAGRGIALALVAVLGRGVQAGTWSLANDFSIASNPNGAWLYGSEALLSGPVNRYTDTVSVPAHYGGTPQLAGWSDPAFGTPPVIAKDMSATNWNFDGRPGGGSVGV